MPESLPINFGGLNNTRDRALVGSNSAWAMSNVKVDNGILQAETGYSVQVATSPGSGQGLGFGRYNGCEEFLAVLGGSVNTAVPSASAWTEIATGAASGDWFFQQFSSNLYGVNNGAGGISVHSVCSTGWTPAAPETPGNSHNIYSTEGWYGKFDNPAGAESLWWNITSLAPSGSGITFTRPGFTPGLYANFTFVPTSVRHWVWDYDVDYKNEPDTFEGTIDFRTNGSGIQDFSKNKHWVMDMIMFRLNPNAHFVDDTFTLTFKTSGGVIIQPTSIGDQTNVFMPNGGERQHRSFYFDGQESAMTEVASAVFRWTQYSPGGVDLGGEEAHFGIALYAGDVLVHDDVSLDVDNPTIDKIKYRYTVTENGVESNLSLNTAETALIPSQIVGLPRSCFVRVGLDPVASAASGAVLTAYRQRKSDLAWTPVGSALNTGTAWTPSSSGTCYVDDTYMEHELEALTAYDGFSLDITATSVQAIGKYKASLGIGGLTNLYLSKVARPTEFEDINAAPDPNDYNQGRSSYVDDTQSENVNMIVGRDVLYLGTKSRIYVMLGDFPKDLLGPWGITNSGPIGGRAFHPYEDGIAYVDKDGVWFVRYDARFRNTGDLDVSQVVATELTTDVKTSFDAMSVNASAVLTVQDGDLLLFQGDKYMRLDRRYRNWTSGTLNHTIVAAVPDYTNKLRLLDEDGKLLIWADGTTFAGSAITWSYTTGDIVVPRSRVIHMRAICSGSPVVTLTSLDGENGSKSQTLTLDEDQMSVYPFESSKAYGSRFQITVTGGVNDKLIGLELEYEILNKKEK